MVNFTSSFSKKLTWIVEVSASVVVLSDELSYKLLCRLVQMAGYSHYVFWVDCSGNAATTIAPLTLKESMNLHGIRVVVGPLPWSVRVAPAVFRKPV